MPIAEFRPPSDPDLFHSPAFQSDSIPVRISQKTDAGYAQVKALRELSQRDLAGAQPARSFRQVPVAPKLFRTPRPLVTAEQVDQKLGPFGLHRQAPVKKEFRQQDDHGQGRAPPRTPIRR